MLPRSGNIYFTLFRLHEFTSRARKSRDSHQGARSCRMRIFVALPVIPKHNRPAESLKYCAKCKYTYIHLLVATSINHSCYSRYRWRETEGLDTKLGFPIGWWTNLNLLQCRGHRMTNFETVDRTRKLPVLDLYQRLPPRHVHQHELLRSDIGHLACFRLLVSHVRFLDDVA